MPDFLTPTTELEAINSILASVGEAPVDAIDGEFVDASVAQLLLTQESRRVQTKGWTFNTETDVTLTPDVDGIIWVPQNTLRFVYSDNTIVQRGLKLYDRANHTNVFTDELTEVELVVGLVFDELPEALRLFLALRAGRRFQDRLQSDQVLHQFQARDELAAWAAFMDYEAEQGQYNVLKNNRLALRLKANRPNG
jgi:hypothetical protein